MIKLEASARLGSSTTIIAAAMKKENFIKAVDAAIKSLTALEVDRKSSRIPDDEFYKPISDTIGLYMDGKKFYLMVELYPDITAQRFFNQKSFEEKFKITSGDDAFTKYASWAQNMREKALTIFDKLMIDTFQIQS